MNNNVTRRDFVKTSTVVGAAVGLRGTVAKGVLGANDRIVVGFIGVGGMGSVTL